MKFSPTVIFCKLAIILCVLSNSSLFNSFAQDTATKQIPRKIDEWGQIPCDDLLARIDNVGYILNSDNQSRIHILSYIGRRTLPGRFIRYAHSIKPHLVEVRDAEPNRITNVVGGQRDIMSIEVWVVPPGAPPPTPDPPYRGEAKDSSVPLKFDEGFADYLMEAGQASLWTRDMDCSTDGVDLHTFSKALSAEPGARGHVIIYNECGKKRRRADVVARLVRREMTRDHHIDGRRIRTVYGGCRNVPSMELWVVPPDVSAPKPTPGKYIEER
jgi:hypothetical protein